MRGGEELVMLGVGALFAMVQALVVLGAMNSGIPPRLALGMVIPSAVVMVLGLSSWYLIQRRQRPRD